uniref:Uncharacterized protein n=1 Tax=Cannabis sativa TaxID=3483 RepID=A0A803QII9_CANSA
MYSSRHTAEDMRWHYCKRPQEDGVIRHPTDSKSWKIFDELYPDFAAEHRNVRLGHNLDVMHIEKNVYDSVLGTLLSIDGKSKDTEKVRLDLADMTIRKKLHLYKVGDKWKKPPTSYTLSVTERQDFCEFVKSVKFPDGFAANLTKNVKDDKISRLKSITMC